jgi:hypothetical protein
VFDHQVTWPASPSIAALDRLDDASTAAFVGRRVQQGTGEGAVSVGASLEPKSRWPFTRQFYSQEDTAVLLRQERAHTLLNKTQENLHEYKWLGAFEPLPSNCPLFARKFAPEAISELAKYVWRCDGLGFAWHCLDGASAPVPA